VPSKAIISLALLKINWEEGRRDYVENFVPFVLDCMPHEAGSPISVSSLRTGLEERFGLRVPHHAISLILNRMRKTGYVEVRDKAFYRTNKSNDRASLSMVRNDVLKTHASLISHAVEFSRQRFDCDWDEAITEDALITYLDRYQVDLISSLTQQRIVGLQTPSHNKNLYVVGQFVRSLIESNSPELNYLDSMVKGNLLANAVLFEEPINLNRQFKDTEVFVDTRILIYALGHAGPANAAPAEELLDLLHLHGGRLRCFEHTYDEITGILDACAQALDHSDRTREYGPSIQHFRTIRATSSDVLLCLAGSKRDLAALNVSVVPTPSYVEFRSVMDEAGFQVELQKHVDYTHPRQWRSRSDSVGGGGAAPQNVPPALVRDVASVSAIMRLRKGRNAHEVENARALFVTSNSGLVRAAKVFLADDLGQNSVPPCITDISLTTLLWLKNPKFARELPRKRIIADMYAATQPSERLWKRYVEEIAKLEKQGHLTQDQYILLRDHLHVRSALMDETLGDEDLITTGTIDDILLRITQDIREQAIADAEKAVANERTARETAETREGLAKKSILEKVKLMDVRARRHATWVVRIARTLLGGFLAIAYIVTIPVLLPTFPRWSAGHIVMLVLTSLLSWIGLIDLWYGRPIVARFRHLEYWLAAWLRRRYSSFAGITQADTGLFLSG
jgi:hypothetical protein